MQRFTDRVKVQKSCSVNLEIPSEHFHAWFAIIIVVADTCQIFSVPDLYFLAVLDEFRVGEIVEDKKRRIGFESRKRVPHEPGLVSDELPPRKQNPLGRSGDECTQGSGTDIRVACRATPFAGEWTVVSMTGVFFAIHVTSNVYDFESSQEAFSCDDEFSWLFTFGTEAGFRYV